MDFRICEINSRRPLNIIFTGAYGHKVIGEMMGHLQRVEPISNADAMVDSLFTLFDPVLPVYFIRGEDSIASTVIFDELDERRTRMRPKITKPSDLRLVPD